MILSYDANRGRMQFSERTSCISSNYSGVRTLLAIDAKRILIMASHMPPIPPANRSKKGTPSEAKQVDNEKLVQHEHHGNTAEKGDTANIKQNTTNAGYFKGRRMK